MDDWILAVILFAGVIWSVTSKKLTPAAALTGAAIAVLVYKGAGFTGFIMMTVFFILGSGATAWKKNIKQTEGLAESENGRRTTGQVIANAGVAGILGLLIWLYPQNKAVLQVMIAGSFASATADTLSSELGNLYGRRFYNILSFKKDTKGLNGVISLEGTLFGLMGSVVIAAIFSFGMGMNKTFMWIIIAGTIGNLTDSVLGATLERKRYLTNNAVNFLNTLTGAIVTFILFNYR